jgi:metallo-beta-lactamase family protein
MSESIFRIYIEDTIRKQGTLIIPAFSLERTQGMLYEINNFFEHGGLTPIPVFLDSPLAITVTDIYHTYTEYLKDSVREQIHSGDDIFDFPKLSFTRSVKDSEEIGKVHSAKIIIAGSGMSHGGRILMHEKTYLEDVKTTLLLVGYQSVGSLGRLLHDGARKVRILDTEVRVKARIASIRGYSGHADRDQLVGFVEKGGENVKKVFVAMGEERASLFLVQRLRDYLGVNAIAPSEGENIEVDF